MGVASLILGIISVVLGIIPFIGGIAIITAILSIVLGIVYLCKKIQKKNKAEAITGIIIAAISFLVIIFNLIFSFVFGVTLLDEIFNNYDYYEDFKFEDEYYDDDYNNYYEEHYHYELDKFLNDEFENKNLL